MFSRRFGAAELLSHDSGVERRKVRHTRRRRHDLRLPPPHHRPRQFGQADALPHLGRQREEVHHDGGAFSPVRRGHEEDRRPQTVRVPWVSDG